MRNQRFSRHAQRYSGGAPQTTPSRLRPTIQFQSSTGVASTAPAKATPALFTITSRPWFAWLQPAMDAATNSCVATSPGYAATCAAPATRGRVAARFKGLASKVEHAQHPAIAGQQLGHCQAEPARSTGDEGAL